MKLSILANHFIKLSLLALLVGCISEQDRAILRLEAQRAKIERDASRQGNPVVAVDFADGDFDATDLSYFTHLERVHTIRLDRTLLTNAWLEAFAKAHLLHKLSIATGWEDVEEYRRPLSPDEVIRFDLRDTQVDGDGLRHLAALTHLQSLYLDFDKIDDSVVQTLSELEAFDNSIDPTDDDATLLEALQTPNGPVSSSFNLDNMQITKDGLRYLSRLVHANAITAHSMDLGGGLEAFCKNPPKKVRTLTFNDCGLSDDDMAHLSTIDNLQWLEVANNQDITDAGIEHFASHTQLEGLDIRGTSVSDELVARWRVERPSVSFRRF